MFCYLATWSPWLLGILRIWSAHACTYAHMHTYIGISTKLLKAIKQEMCKPLTIIINQSGIFPDSLKIAKVISLYKKGDKPLLDNYRPISILPSISKIVERVMFNQIHVYFSSHNLYYNGKYIVLEKNTPLN